MTPARQVIRWAIPGYLLFIFLGTFALVRAPFVFGLAVFDLAALRALPDSLFYTKYILPQLLVFVGMTGIPLGFLLYQLYFWGYWGGRGFMRTEPQDKGWEIVKDINVDWEALFGRKAGVPQHCPIKRTLRRRPETTKCLLRNWHLSQSLMCLVLDKSNWRYVRENTQYLTDMYHSVGTTRMALVFCFVFLYSPWAIGRDILVIFSASSLCDVLSSPHVWSIAASLVLFCAIYLLLSSTRGRVLEDLLSLEHKFLAIMLGVKEDEPTP